MSFEKLKEKVLSGFLDIGSKHNGNPAHNDLIRAVGKRHKVGFFESIHKLLMRSSVEEEETCNALWEHNLISFNDGKTGDEYTRNNVGSLNELYKKLNIK